MTRERTTTMVGKRPGPSVVSVPQNFIPGLTKPRLSVDPEPLPDKVERKPTSVCFHGVRVRIADDAGLVDRTALNAGLIGLSLPTPSVHLDCTEHGIPLFVHVNEDIKPKRASCKHSDNGLPPKINWMEHRKAARSMTAPSKFAAAKKESWHRARTLPAGDLQEKQPVDARNSNSLKQAMGGRESYVSKLAHFIRLDSLVSTSLPLRKTSLSSSLPEIRVESDSDEIDNSNGFGNEKHVARSMSCVVGTSDGNQPSSKVIKRKYSRSLMRKSQHMQENYQKAQEKKEREMYGALQDAMRSKLPKTFIATANMFNPILGAGHRANPPSLKKASKAKSEGAVRRKRAGSVPAIFLSRLSNHSEEQASTLDSPNASRPTRPSVAMASKIERITGSPKLGQTFMSDNNLKTEIKLHETANTIEHMGRLRRIELGSNRDSSSSTDSGIIVRNLSGDELDNHVTPRNSIHDCPNENQSRESCPNCYVADVIKCSVDQVDNVTAAVECGPSSPASESLTENQQPPGITEDSDISKVKVQDSARKRKTSYQVNIKVAEDKRSVKYKQISSTSIKISTRSLSSQSTICSDDSVKVDIASSSQNMLTQSNQEKIPSQTELDVPRKTSQRERPKLMLAKLPPVEVLVPLAAPVVSKLHVVQPVSVQSVSPATAPKHRIHRPNRKEIKAILESFKADLFNKLPKINSTETSKVSFGTSACPSLERATRDTMNTQKRIVKAPRWKGDVVLVEAPHLELAIQDSAPLKLSPEVACDPVRIVHPLPTPSERKVSFTRSCRERLTSNVGEYIPEALRLDAEQEALLGYGRAISAPAGEDDALRSLNAMLTDLEEFSKVFSYDDGRKLERIPNV